jgi:hypothetical protein
VLQNLDVFKESGQVKLKAVVKGFRVNAGPTGTIVVQFIDGTSNAFVSALEVLP